jgi:cysteine-rich repeat protein
VCNEEPGWTCSGGGLNKVDVCSDTCGDGQVKKRDPADYCDDGNKAGGGCDDSCKTVPGWSCTGGTTNSPDTCTEICEDGLLVGTEVCDDGGLPSSGNGDGCSSTCQVETGWTCKQVEGLSVCEEKCGDGINIGKKPCDDGNTADGDGCSSTCTIEDGWTCDGGSPTSPDVCAPILTTGSSDECKTFAAKFENTCDVTVAPSSCSKVKSASVYCKKTGACQEDECGENEKCYHKRRLCATCVVKGDG